MKLRKVISGGQTGADRTGLECAKELGLVTGGTAPRGYRTEQGPDLKLREFGLTESHYSDYAVRTRQNVMDAEVTLWFGNVGSPGYWCTRKAAEKYNKTFITNPDAAEMQRIANTYETINIAGNRARLNPNVIQLVKTAFDSVKAMQ